METKKDQGIKWNDPDRWNPIEDMKSVLESPGYFRLPSKPFLPKWLEEFIERQGKKKEDYGN